MKKGNREKVDEKILKDSVKRALAQPRLAFYSPLAACILNYRKNTIPRYSISEELAGIMEDALRSKWPQLAGRAEKLLGKKRASQA